MSDTDTLKRAADRLRGFDLEPSPATGGRPQDIPDATIEELMTLRTSARLAAEDFGAAIKAQAEKYCCRAGELLREIEPAKGGDRKSDEYQRDGADPLVSRKAAAEAAGMSERQRKTAISVASIPQDRFDAEVESSPPSTVTRLREIAKPKDTSPIGATAVRQLWGDAAADDPEAFKGATQIAAALYDLVTLYEHSPSPARVVAVMRDHERSALRRSLMALSPFIAETMEALS